VRAPAKETIVLAGTQWLKWRQNGRRFRDRFDLASTFDPGSSKVKKARIVRNLNSR